MCLSQVLSFMNAVFKEHISSSHYSQVDNKSSVVFVFDETFDLRDKSGDVLSTINDAANGYNISVDFDYDDSIVTVERN